MLGNLKLRRYILNSGEFKILSLTFKNKIIKKTYVVIIFGV